MQLKMRENSLFAVLLRSPWWYSFLIASGVVMGAFALLRPSHAIYSIAIGGPFLGIALYRAFVQLRSPGERDFARVETAVRGMNTREFVDVLSRAYADAGYDVAPFKGKAAELQIEQTGRVTLVSCKRVKAASNGVQPLQELASVGERVEAAHLTFITFGEVSADAREFARDNDITIVGLDELTTLAGKHID